MDTVVRKFQTIKDELTNAIMNSGNGVLSQFLKDFLDSMTMFLRVMNLFSSETYTAIVGVDKPATSIYIGHKSVKAFTVAMVAMGIIGTGLIGSMSRAWVKNGIGLAIFGIIEALQYAIEEYNNLANASKLVLDQTLKEYEAKADI